MQEQQTKKTPGSAADAAPRRIAELSPADLAEWNAWREEDDRAWRMYEAYGNVAA